jgi:hypothetical protein
MTMRRLATLLAISTMPLLGGGCVASVVADVVTAPIKIVGKSADLLTTSQSEFDENRGRALRHRDEKLGKLSRDRDEYGKKCAKHGKESDCRRADDADAEIRELMARPI